MHRFFTFCIVVFLYLVIHSPTSSYSSDKAALSDRLKLAKGLFDDGLYALAINEFERFKAQDLEKDEACTVELFLGKSYLFTGEFEKSQPLLKHVIEGRCSLKEQEEAYYYTGDSYMNLGNRISAKEYFEKLKNFYPESSFGPLIDENLSQIIYFESVAHFEKQNYNKAMKGFDSVLKLGAKGVPLDELYVRKGDSLFYLEKYLRAEEAYRKAKELSKTDDARGRIEFQLAAILYNKGEYDGAITSMRSFLEKYPDHPLSTNGKNIILWSLYRMGKYNEAFDYLTVIENEGNENVNSEVGDVVDSATRLVILNEYADAVKMLEAALMEYGKDPLNGEIMYILAKAYRGKSSTTMEEATYLEIVKRYGTSPAAKKSLFELGRINFEKGLFKKASDYFRSYIEWDSLGSLADDAAYYLAEALFRRGEIDEARNNFASLVENFKDSEYVTGSYQRMADVEALLGNYLKAAALYQSITKNAPEEMQEELLWKTADAYRKGGDVKAAIKVFNRFIKKYPDSERVTEAKSILGEMNYSSGEYAEGISVFRKMLESGKGNAISSKDLLRLVWGYIKLNDLPDALKTLNIILERYPESEEAAKAHYLKGWLAEKNGKYDTANDEYEKLLKNFPSTALREEVKWRMADNYFLLGDYKASLKGFKEFARDFPDSYKDSEGMIRKNYVALEDYKRALEASSVFLEVSPDKIDELKKRFEESMALFDVGSYGDALKMSESIIDQFPSHTYSAKLMVMRGEIYFKRKKYERAAKLFMNGQELLVSGPLRDLACFRLGDMAFGEDDFRGSLMELEKVPASFDSYGGSISELERFIEPSYLLAKSYFLKGVAYLNLGLVDKSVQNLTLFIDNFPDLKGLEEEKLKAGLIFQQQKEYEKAIRTMEQIISVAEDVKVMAEAQYWIGECYQYAGDLERAVIEYLKVAYLYPAEGLWPLTARYKAAQAYQDMGRFEDAIKLFKIVAKESKDKRKSEYAKKRVEELADRLMKNSNTPSR